MNEKQISTQNILISEKQNSHTPRSVSRLRRSNWRKGEPNFLGGLAATTTTTTSLVIILREEFSFSLRLKIEHVRRLKSCEEETRGKSFTTELIINWLSRLSVHETKWAMDGDGSPMK